MSVIERLGIKDSTELRFSINLEGANLNEVAVTLQIEAKNFDISIPGKVESREAIFVVKGLENVLKPGVYNFHLNAVVRNEYFRLVEEQLEFIQPITASSEYIKKSEKSELMAVSAEFKTRKTVLGSKIPLAELVEKVKDFSGTPKFEDSKNSVFELVGDDAESVQYVEGYPGLWKGAVDSKNFVVNTRSGEVVYDS